MKATILEVAIALVRRDNNEGICLACGTVHSGVEPDARKYTCDKCGEKKVYGAEEAVLMGGILNNDLRSNETGS